MGKGTHVLLGAALIVFGLIVGLLTGISQSPVVAVLLPLIFSLATAGGAVYIARAPQKSDALLGPTMAARASLLAGQLLAFSLGFLPGLWLGVDAKLSPGAYWGAAARPVFEPSFSEFSFKEIELLRAARAVDIDLFRAKVGKAERRRILKELLGAIDARRVGGDISSGDTSAIGDLLSAKKDEELSFDPINWELKPGPVAEYIPPFDAKPDKKTEGA